MDLPATTAKPVPPAAPEPDLTPLQRSVSRFHDWESAEVEGELPRGLAGTLIRTGPGLLERFGSRLTHSFEADGALTALRLSGQGTADVSVRVVESPGYREEEAAGRALYGSAAPRWRRLLNNLRGKAKHTGNTNVVHWQGRTFALMEGAAPIEIDHATLKTGDVADFGGVVTGAFSAHPHRIESTRTLFNFGQGWGRKPELRMYALPDDGPARVIGQVPVPWNTMVHDFAVTERYAVFCVCPAMFQMSKVLTASKDFQRYFEWDGTQPSYLVVAPLDDPAAAKQIPIDARWVFHFSNAFERDGQLVVDWVEYPDFGVFSALGVDAELDGPAGPSLHRLVVDPEAGKLVRDELLLGDAPEFPVLPAGRFGYPYTTAWYVLDTPGHGGGITRLDSETGAIDAWRPGRGYHASEALFVPRPEASREDEGWLVSLIYDGFIGRSYFGVFDADRPSAGPLAKAWLEQPIPLTFHGTFIPRR